MSDKCNGNNLHADAAIQERKLTPQGVLDMVRADVENLSGVIIVAISKDGKPGYTNSFMTYTDLLFAVRYANKQIETILFGAD